MRPRADADDRGDAQHEHDQAQLVHAFGRRAEVPHAEDLVRFERLGRHPPEELRVEEVGDGRERERERRHREVEAAQAQRGEADDDRDGRAGEADEQDREREVEAPVGRRLGAERAADRDEAHLPERHLPGPAGEDRDREADDREQQHRRGLERVAGASDPRQVRERDEQHRDGGEADDARRGAPR